MKESVQSCCWLFIQPLAQYPFWADQSWSHQFRRLSSPNHYLSFGYLTYHKGIQSLSISSHMEILSRLSLPLRFLPISGLNLCNRHLRCHLLFNGLRTKAITYEKPYIYNMLWGNEVYSFLFFVLSVHCSWSYSPIQAQLLKRVHSYSYCHLINAEIILTHKGPHL